MQYHFSYLTFKIFPMASKMFDLDNICPLNFLVKHLRTWSPNNLVPFSPGEHDWGYHFVSSLRKAPFSFRHLAWKICLESLFFHPFCSEEEIFLKKRIKPWTLQLKWEILTIRSFFSSKILCNKNNKNVNYSPGTINLFFSCWAFS
jgi:hypothetical protein